MILMIIYALMSLLVTAASGAFWIVAAPEVTLKQSALWVLGFIASYVLLWWFVVSWRGFFFVGILAPFVWGGAISSLARKKDSFEQMRYHAASCFRLIAWLYVVGTAITACVGLIVGGGPVFERGRLFVENYWMLFSTATIWIWLFRKIHVQDMSTQHKFFVATSSTLVIATVFLAKDMAILRYYLGPFGRSLSQVQVYKNSSEDMESIDIEGTTVFVDKSPVTNAQFIRFLNENPEWQPNGAKGREFILKNRGIFYNVYLRGMDAAFNYVPIDWMFVPDDDLDKPVTHINNSVSEAYAKWVGKRIPTMSELEVAQVDIGSISYHGGSSFYGHITSDNPAVISHEGASLRCAMD